MEHFSVLYSIAFNVRNTGTIWCGNFKLNSNGNSMDGMVFQYGNGQRTAIWKINSIGLPYTILLLKYIHNIRNYFEC